MSFPTTLDAISPSFLSEVLGQTVVAVATTELDEPWTSTVAVLTATLQDGASHRLVAKVRRAGRGHPSQFTQELHFYRHVAHRLSCVPTLRFGAMEGDDAFLLVLDHAGGSHLRDGFDLQTTRRALHTLAQVHGTAWGDASLRAGLRDKPVLRSEASELAAGVAENWEAVAGRFPRHLEAPPDLSTLPDDVETLEPLTLTHNDLHAENVLVSPDRVVFVDWQNATWSTPAYDVANVLAGCARPDVQRGHWREMLAHYSAGLRDACRPPLPVLEADVATATSLLFAWMMRYLATVSDAQAAERTMLVTHWERVCTGVDVSSADRP